MRIAVGISGGVDSAAAAALCKEQNHEVLGVFMKIWKDDGASHTQKSGRNACYGPEEKHDLEDARKICEKIGIPLHVIDLTDEFHTEILSYFKDTYLHGKTPNPCVFCNQQLKFGLMPTLLKSQNISFDLFATGHYAVIQRDLDGTAHLKRAHDKAKDQSYFLYRLSRDQIRNAVFPLGNLTKAEARTVARRFDLHVWDKEESQDFYSGDYRELITGENTASPIGEIVDTSGKMLGTHDGIWNFTVGQRKGLGVSSPKPLYVVEIRGKENKIVLGELEELKKSCIVISDFNQLELIPERAECKIRSSSPLYECTIEHVGEKIIVHLDSCITGISPGQSAVIYKDDTVIGGGIIE